MSENLSYIPLDTIITDYLNESEQGMNKYFKLFHIAFRGMENMGLDAFYRVRSVKLKVNSNLTVNLPEDYQNWTKVGILNNKGEIIPMAYNEKLTTYADIYSDRLDKTQDNTLLDYTYGNWDNTTWVNYWGGNFFINLYGVPSGYPHVGSFKIDLDNGLIVLNESFSYDYVMLEYVASPVASQNYNLPVQFREAMMAWLWWKDKKAVNISRGQVGLSRDLKNDFFNERRNAIARYKPIRKEEIYNASQEMTRLAVKT